MTADGPPPSKLPDGKTILFTMEIQDWIDALLWEDEEHDPWTEQNLELRYIADNSSDGNPPTIHGWELILECAKQDYQNTKIKEFGEFCREVIYTLTGDDPGAWREKAAKIVFESYLGRFNQGERRLSNIRKVIFDEQRSNEAKRSNEEIPEFTVEMIKNFMTQVNRRKPDGRS